MNIRTRHYHDVAILSVTGRMDAVAVAQFAEAVAEQFAHGFHCLVVDLKQVDFISSGVLNVMAQAAQETRQQGGDVRLAQVQSRVKGVLQLAGLDHLLKAYPTVVGATASYFSPCA